MPQTSFVFQNAQEQKLTPIIVLNKFDRPNARQHAVLDEVRELFIELSVDDELIDLPVIYTSANNGTSGQTPQTQKETMDPLFNTIIHHIPAPVNNVMDPLQFQVTLLDYNDYLGRIGIGRIFRGEME